MLTSNVSCISVCIAEHPSKRDVNRTAVLRKANKSQHNRGEPEGGIVMGRRRYGGFGKMHSGHMPAASGNCR